MRIGIDAHVLGKNLGGVERFVAELVRGLPQQTPAHDYVVFVTKSQFATLANHTADKVRYVPLACANPLIERLILLPWLARKHQLDALLVQRLAPWFCGKCKLVVAIHDLTPIKFKAAYKGLSNRLVRLLTKNTIQRADLILTPTKAIEAEIRKYCPNVSAPIEAFYNGVDAQAFTQVQVVKQPAGDKPYFLTVGAIERRKNVETIIAMMAKLSDASIELHVLGGVRDQSYLGELKALTQTLGLESRVHFLGFLSEADLIACYQQARLFITASKDEGFNIPPLEAMACGVPLVCSSIPVHLELFEDSALFFNPNSVDLLHVTVEHALNKENETNALVKQGHMKVKQLTWQNTANNVASAINRIAM